MNGTPLNIVLLFLASSFFSGCSKNLKHERYVYNKSADTIIVSNPDYGNAIDTILPTEKALVFSYEVLDTKQQSELCAWEGDTLYIYTLDSISILRSIKAEGNWTTELIGDKNRIQVCTFIVSEDDF